MAFMSYSMKIISPAWCFFLGGLQNFFPDELQTQALVYVKSLPMFKPPALASQDLEALAEKQSAATKVS